MNSYVQYTFIVYDPNGILWEVSTSTSTTAVAPHHTVHTAHSTGTDRRRCVPGEHRAAVHRAPLPAALR